LLLVLCEAATLALTLFVLVGADLTLLGVVQGSDGYHIRPENGGLGKSTRLRTKFGTPGIVAWEEHHALFTAPIPDHVYLPFSLTAALRLDTWRSTQHNHRFLTSLGINSAQCRV
jgi:hypothetical protein